MDNGNNRAAQLSFLRDLRIRKGLSQKGVAKIFKLKGENADETIGDWEAGKEDKNPSPRKHRITFIRYLVIVLGVSDRTEFNAYWKKLETHWKFDAVTDEEWQTLERAPLIQIPPPPTIEHTVGCEDEVNRIVAQLKVQRLVYIVGMPGAGKTTLAAMVARKLTTIDRICWCRCFPNGGFSAIIHTIALFLSHAGQDALLQRIKTDHTFRREELNYILELVDAQECVLCIDDFQYIDNDPLVEEFISLLCSKQTYDHSYLLLVSQRLPSFDHSANIIKITGLNERDAQQFLLMKDITLPEKLFTELYVQTEGNPQLLILAIAVLRQTSRHTEIIKDLAASMNIERYLLDRIDEKLQSGERDVMRALSSLHDYGGTRKAIESLLEGRNVRNSLLKLCDMSLVRFIDIGDSKGYLQHFIVRRFYYDGLDQQDRIDFHRRAGSYYTAEEIDNLRAALHFEFANEYVQATELALKDPQWIVNRGQSRILRQILDRLFVQLHTLPVSIEMSRLGAQICIVSARLWQYDNPETALKIAQQGLTVISDFTSESPNEAAELSLLAGAILTKQAKFQNAVSQLEQARAILQSVSVHSHLQVRAEYLLGRAAYFQEDDHQAERYWLEAMNLNQSLSALDSKQQITILEALAVLADNQSNWPVAETYYQDARRLAEQEGDRFQITRLTQNIGLLRMNQGNHTEALQYLSDAYKLAQELGITEYKLVCRSGLSDLSLRQGKAEKALPYLEEATQLAIDMNDISRLMEIDRRWAELYLAKSDLPQARSKIDAALEKARAVDESKDEGLSQRTLGQILRVSGDIIGAQAAFEASLALLNASHDRYEAARTKVELGNVLRIHMDIEGDRWLLEARSTFEELGAQYDLQALP